MAVAVEGERRNGVAGVVAIDRRSLVADTTIRLGLAKLADPYNREPLTNIIRETGTQIELNGLARTLVRNGKDYAKSVLRWAVIDELKRIEP